MHHLNLTLRIESFSKVWVWLLLAIFLLSFVHLYWQIENNFHFLKIIVASFYVNFRIQRAQPYTNFTRFGKVLAVIAILALAGSLALSNILSELINILSFVSIVSTSLLVGLFFSIVLQINNDQCTNIERIYTLKNSSRTKFREVVFGNFSKSNARISANRCLVKLRINRSSSLKIACTIVSKLRTVSVNVTSKFFRIPQYHSA